MSPFPLEWTDETRYGRCIELARESGERTRRVQGVAVGFAAVERLLGESQPREELRRLEYWLVATTTLPDSATLIRVTMMPERLAYLCVVTDDSFQELVEGSMIPIADYRDIHRDAQIPAQYQERVWR